MILQFAIRYSLFAIFIFLLPGCSSISLPSLPSWPWSTPATQPNATAEALFDEGTAYLNNKKYALAIDRFQKVKAEFPFSPQLVPAELKLAEAYYLNKQYPEAAAAFKEFQTLHPNNENIPFVLYHRGLVHFDQFTSSDRYQKMTEIAKGYFESVVKDHPGSPYAAPAREKLAKCIEYLSEHEFNIAVFYFNEKKYPAAIDRLEEILRRYRDTPFAVKALYYLGESYRLEKNTVKAGLAYEALIHHYPEDPLAKPAQARVSELAQEKQDPLAMLLKRDSRPVYTPPPPEGRRQKAVDSRQAAESSEQIAEGSQRSAVSGQRESSGEIQNPKSKIENPKDLNLVAKKEVVHEEPGDEKGMFRRVMDTLNPFASSSDKKENGNKIDTAKGGAAKEESNGFFGSLWRGLNPFAKEDKAKIDVPRDPQLVGRVDESLKQKGIDVRSQKPEAAIQNPKSKIQNLEITPPASDLPNVEEATPPPSNTAELLGRIDTKLSKEGKEAGQLPTPPEAAPFFKAAKTEGRKPAVSRTESASPPATKGLIAGIDQALKQKGIEPAKVETTTKTEDRRPTTESSGLPSAVTGQKKVELAPKLPQEKGPLFLDTGDYQGQRFDGLTVPSGVEGEKAQEGQASEPAVTQPARSAEGRKEIPQAVVKGPQPVPAKEKIPKTKVAEKKQSPDEEDEPKGALDQLREDLGRVRDALNPFSW